MVVTPMQIMVVAMKQTNDPNGIPTHATQDAVSPLETTSVLAGAVDVSDLPPPERPLGGSSEIQDATLQSSTRQSCDDEGKDGPNNRRRKPTRGRAAGSCEEPPRRSPPLTSPPLDRLISLAEVMRRTTFSKATVYRKAADRSFPAPIKIGRHRVAWRASELATWLDDLPRAA